MLALLASITKARPRFSSGLSARRLVVFLLSCVGSSFGFFYGEGGPIEFELSTVVREYRISWEKTLADLTELAKLRWGSNWTEARIAEHLGLSYDSVHMRLRGLMQRNGCYGQLSPSVQKLVPRPR
jgi:hypothetical protein